jgi:hypothetical protein
MQGARAALVGLVMLMQVAERAVVRCTLLQVARSQSTGERSTLQAMVATKEFIQRVVPAVVDQGE